MRVNDSFENELKCIESSIVSVYRQEPTLLDSEVDRALATMITVFKSQVKGKNIPEHKLDGLDLLVFEAVKVAIMLLRQDKTDLTDDDLLQCLKTIKKSVARWTKQLGRQGYLGFVSPYFQ